MRMLLVCLAFMMGSFAHAQQYGFFAGINSTVFDSPASWDREMGFGIGGQMFYPINESIDLRTGAGFVQKNSSLKLAGLKGTMKFTYLEIPATALFKVNETVGIFAGLNFDLKVADSCSATGGATCSTDGAKSFMYNLVVGGRFHLAEQHHIETTLELGLSNLAEKNDVDTKIGNSLAVQYAYQF